jgi:putative transposase
VSKLVHVFIVLLAGVLRFAERQQVSVDLVLRRSGQTPNHWHLVVWPERDGDLSEFIRWRTLTHTQRWHAKHATQGTGPLYQGRFKAFPVAKDEHCLRVLRYVERNPLRAGVARSARRWRWSSLGRATLRLPGPPLETGPVAKPEPWQEWVAQPETEAELSALRRSVARGVPFGAESWQRQAAKCLGLESSLWHVGRPSKSEKVPENNDSRRLIRPEVY